MYPQSHLDSPCAEAGRCLGEDGRHNSDALYAHTEQCMAKQVSKLSAPTYWWFFAENQADGLWESHDSDHHGERAPNACFCWKSKRESCADAFAA